MGEVVYIGTARATRIEGDPWRIIDAHVVPYGADWGVAYRCANGKSVAHHVGTRDQAQQALRPLGSCLPPPAVEARRSGGDDRLLSVMMDLYASSIHTQIASASAKGWIVRLGDRQNGCVAERVFANDHLDRATEWLIKEAMRAYPGSVFAQHYTGFAAS
jgi:hypothetical protein